MLYGNKSIRSSCAYRATFRNTGFFNIVSVEQTSSEIRINLDELMNPYISDYVYFEYKGFMNPIHVTDFPIRDHKVVLIIRCRRWIDIRTGKSFSIPVNLDVACNETRYSKEFVVFKKDIWRHPQ